MDSASEVQVQVDSNKTLSARAIPLCRYGCGCTHMMDPVHREKFRHPNVPKLNDEQLQSQFICNECGFATKSIPELQLHLKRKTAWSNKSLVGCRINCLVDYKEWYEGIVLSYHKSGKHFVEFRMVNERRWLIMKKIYFYIIERPHHSLQLLVSDVGSSEYKENNFDADILAPIEDCWVYEEDISIDFAFAQSVLFKIYGNVLQETGHLTMGHICLTRNDKATAVDKKGSLLYGELLPRGVNKALGAHRLHAARATSLFDLGMGTGKILIQAFLQYKNLTYVHGVELSEARYRIAEEALLKMVQLLGANSYQVHICPGQYILVKEIIISNISPSKAAQRVNSNRSDLSELPNSDDHDAQDADDGDGDDDVDGSVDVEGVVNNSKRTDRGEAGIHAKTVSEDANRQASEGMNDISQLECLEDLDVVDVVDDNVDDDDDDDDSEVEAEYIERVIHLKCGNMFDIENIGTADIVMMETDVPSEQFDNLKHLLLRMKDHGRLLTYLDLRKVFDMKSRILPFKQLDDNRQQSDRYPTSWSVQRGHHFYLWTKCSNPEEMESTAVQQQSKSPANESHYNIGDDCGSPISTAPLRIMLQGGAIAHIHTNQGGSPSVSPSISPFSSPITNTILTGRNSTITSALNPNIDSPIILQRLHSLSTGSDESPYQSQYQYQQHLFSQSNINNINNNYQGNNNNNAMEQSSLAQQQQSLHSTSYHHSNSSLASMDLDSATAGVGGCLPCSLFSLFFGSRKSSSDKRSDKTKTLDYPPQKSAPIPALRPVDVNNDRSIIPLNNDGSRIRREKGKKKHRSATTAVKGPKLAATTTAATAKTRSDRIDSPTADPSQPVESASSHQLLNPCSSDRRLDDTRKGNDD